jgi:PPOX class probable F420-dependent enzyme
MSAQHNTTGLALHNATGLALHNVTRAARHDDTAAARGNDALATRAENTAAAPGTAAPAARGNDTPATRGDDTAAVHCFDAAVARGGALETVGSAGSNAAAARALMPFVDQKTIVLTTFRRDGTPVNTPINIAVDGDHAFIRSFAKAWKVRRMRHNPLVELAPSTTLGTATGPAMRARVRLLDDQESKPAARALARKYPLLQGILVPVSHRLFRFKTGRTVHFELTPLA